MGWFANLLNRMTKSENPARSYSPWPLQYVPADLRLSEDEMLSLSTVWAAVRALVDPIASSEWKVFTRDSANKRTLLPDDALAWLFNVRPCPDLTAQAFKEIILSQTIIYGNGYAEIVKDKAGRVVELWPLRSDAMRVEGTSSGLVYVYTQPQDGQQAALAPDQVLHIRGPSIAGLMGDSTITRAAKSIALAVAQEKFATAYYQNGTVLGGVLKLPTTLNQQTLERLKADWKSKYGGNRAHNIAILENGASFEQFETDADKAQLIPSRTFSVEEIARYFGVPLVRLGVQAAAQGYGTNVEQLNLQFVRDTLTPWVNRVTEEVVYKCFPMRAPWREVEIDLTWLTLGDSRQRAATYAVNIRSGVMSVNECREIEGLNAIPEGDLHLVESGLTILSEENLTKPAPPPPPAEPEQDEEEAEEDQDAEQLQALASVLTSLLGRYGKRLSARAADLRKSGHAPEAIEANLEAERTKLVPALVSECQDVLLIAGHYSVPDNEIIIAAQSVEAGVAADKAAAHLAAGLR